MRVLKWISLTSLAITGVFLINLTLTFFVGEFSGITYGGEFIALAAIVVLLSIILISAYALVLMKSIRHKESRKYYIFINLAGLFALTYLFSFAKCFSHSALWEGQAHKHSLVEILPHVH